MDFDYKPKRSGLACIESSISKKDDFMKKKQLAGA
jgi:hypothetical protein